MSEMTECKLELPYKLIDTGFGDERFILSLKRISGADTWVDAFM